MSVIIIMLIGSLSALQAGFLLAFLWCVRDGQFDDEFSPAQQNTYLTIQLKINQQSNYYGIRKIFDYDNKIPEILQ
jgi:cbb3-type cytochrome oxidase maturation protein